MRSSQALVFFIHNWVSWAFMLGLLMVLFLWIKDNIPKMHDLKWLAQGGGLFTKGLHPPSTKFNARSKNYLLECDFAGFQHFNFRSVDVVPIPD